MNKQLAPFLAAAVIALAACGGSADSSAVEVPSTTQPDTTPPTTGAPTVTEVPVTQVPATDAPTTDPADSISEATEGWKVLEPEGDCVCADGSDFEFWERPGDPAKVVLYFEGGGACFNAESCDFEDGSYRSSLELGEAPSMSSGIFDRLNPENPLADHTIVYVPYCSGDGFLGDATTEYSPDLTVVHNGFNNASEGLDHVVENYPDVEQLLVTGESAGSIPTALFAGLAADELPDAEIITFGDSSGAYPDVPALNETIGGLWDTTKNIPDWPGTEGLTAAEWGIPSLYIYVGQHAPGVTFARFDYAFDETQAFFGALAGVPADELVTLIDGSAAEIEAQGVALSSYVAPGTDHTILSSNELYEMEVAGVRLIDFLRALINGEVPPDVHCVECDAP
ncbi:MAG: hypothetical protein DRJ50_00050 [Actinobacteria bacterium]|nr:MAG: hypothetical protein DRJ50_00050 [Actinomycetota bacterium]